MFPNWGFFVNSRQVRPHQDHVDTFFRGFGCPCIDFEDGSPDIPVDCSLRIQLVVENGSGMYCGERRHPARNLVPNVLREKHNSLFPHDIGLKGKNYDGGCDDICLDIPSHPPRSTANSKQSEYGRLCLPSYRDNAYVIEARPSLRIMLESFHMSFTLAKPSRRCGWMIAVAPSFDWQVPDYRYDTDCDMVENVPDNGEDGWSDGSGT